MAENSKIDIKERLRSHRGENCIRAEPVCVEAVAHIEQLESELTSERSHLQLLQKALMFWLPMVPDSPDDVSQRTGDDAMLLIGYEGEDEPSAQELGWLSLADTRRYRWLRSRPLDSIEKGGVFAGLVPDNVVLSEDDLDAEIDAAINKEPAA